MFIPIRRLVPKRLATLYEMRRKKSYEDSPIALFDRFPSVLKAATHATGRVVPAALKLPDGFTRQPVVGGMPVSLRDGGRPVGVSRMTLSLNPSNRSVLGLVCIMLICTLTSGCSRNASESAPSDPSMDGEAFVESNLVGSIKIDGSSTVQPISDAVREEFLKLHPEVDVTVGGNGTGNGFKSFYDKGADISDASRPIQPGEFAKCQANGVEFLELPVAYDGLTIAVHPENDWVEELTIEQLTEMFVGEDAAKTWSDVDPSWPNEPIKIFAPGTGSGTYDYFHEILAKVNDKQLRRDMTLNENDNILVQGVASNKFSIGFFGVAYYTANQQRLRAVPIVNPKDKVAYLPTVKNISTNRYAPFSRPLFIYVNSDSLTRAEVQVFVDFYIKNVSQLCRAANSVRLPESIMNRTKHILKTKTLGTHFVSAEGEHREGAFADLFTQENLVK
ncbi:MAG: PstS family phosphate ABC transporter substrate-binding protein [Rhodopirellula sp. JB044]|uniref:PstS family phosphate ABC transporter substrate-binding protein n=1 Tax=Rhodopirellula sp. JB044 TaxID=3342844 RepID=UPI00370C03E5